MQPSDSAADRAVVTARWILPVDRRPIEHGWVEVLDHRVVGVSAGRPPSGARDLGEVALLPGMVNAHTHLEFSWLAGRIPPAETFPEWLRTMIAARAEGGPRNAAQRLAAMGRIASTMHRTGTVIVGDVSNTLDSIPPLGAAGLSGVVFHELFGFRTPDPATEVQEAWNRIEATPTGRVSTGRPGQDLRAVVSAHAPYSVSPGLFDQIARQHRVGPLTVHLAESAEELEFLRNGTGPLRDLLEELDVWEPGWRPPGCGPVEYLARVGYLREGVLAVHGVHLGDADLERLRDAGAALVTCPRSNVWVGAGLPRLARAYALGLPVAVGTDSLASVETVNLFDELTELRRIAPEVAAASLLESATRVGAEALGFGDRAGTIEPGRQAAFVAVDVPEGERDVEEYLVSGVPASSVRPLWL